MPAEFVPNDMLATLAEAQRWLLSAAEDPGGALCPCCGRFDKVYDRKISAATIRSLFDLHRYSARHGAGYHHYSQFLTTTATGPGDFAKLMHLDLIERAPNSDERKKTSGLYRITVAGDAFCRGRLRVPSRVILYHGELIGFGGDPQRIDEFWPDFDYRELMEAA